MGEYLDNKSPRAYSFFYELTGELQATDYVIFKEVCSDFSFL